MQNDREPGSRDWVSLSTWVVILTVYPEPGFNWLKVAWVMPPVTTCMMLPTLSSRSTKYLYVGAAVSLFCHTMVAHVVLVLTSMSDT